MDNVAFFRYVQRGKVRHFTPELPVTHVVAVRGLDEFLAVDRQPFAVNLHDRSRTGNASFDVILFFRTGVFEYHDVARFRIGKRGKPL